MKKFLPLLFLVSAETVTASQSVYIYGEATGTEDSRQRYTEEHHITESRHDVTYRLPDGKLLADKNMHYQRGFQTPTFQLYDHRFGRKSGSRWEDGQWIVWQEEVNGKRDEKNLEAADNLVIDAGFNYFVLEHFDDLRSGHALDFTFGITDPPMGIDMVITQQDCKDPVFSLEVKTNLCLKAISRSPLLRWFVDEIYLAYYNSAQVETPLLALYQGPSNLPGDDDKGQTVRILYRYDFSQSQP